MNRERKNQTRTRSSGVKEGEAKGKNDRRKSLFIKRYLILSLFSPLYSLAPFFLHFCVCEGVGEREKDSDRKCTTQPRSTDRAAGTATDIG